ncbi:MAG: Oxidoreductase, short-chain dehydrogenase/reductase family [Pseudolabrys sp.]|jgi:3-oxoacyl-[acyl-carrier protein] reductase|nr:Oxidoreductase, short-chain dehydrogenase/reductase family [Pseudolabrys sp.]
MNQIDLKDRVAVVTGGASGLGLAIVERLLRSGARCVVWDYDAKALAALRGRLSAVTGFETDVSHFDAVTKATADTLKQHGRIDILVNNAGITGATTKVWDYPVDEWARVFRINVDGPFYCAKAVLPHMRAAGYGRVVNIASVAGKDGNPNASGYSASKAAVIALTKSLGKELADTEIRVNCVTPAAVKTSLFEQLPQSHIDFMLSKIPLGRFGRPEEIAALVAWLSSEECSFSTGAVFDLSGGRSTY